ncbi:MAG: hypothetical protein ACLFT3_11355 [Cyclobacteriaceae bacterium]
MDEQKLKRKEERESLSLSKNSHRHDYFEQGNYLICKVCQKRILNLRPGKKENLMIGNKSDGSKYTVRKDRHRYFFPQEWEKFIKLIKNKKAYRANSRLENHAL